MRTGEIKALSGLRILAALWVVVFHFRPLLEQAAPGVRSALAPVLDNGAQGVDLFFILSGFVLTWSYLERMGQSWSTRATLRFLWLRLARVWPVYLVTLHLAAAWIIFTLYVGHVPSPEVVELSAGNYVRQVLLVQLWSVPFFDGTSWNGPAWSISAEWLAYLLFGGLILVIFRIGQVTRGRSLLLLAVLASLPPTLLLLASGHFYTPYSWLPRIIMQFIAGALACAAVRKFRFSDRAQRVTGYLSLLLAAVIIGLLYVLDAHPPEKMLDAAGLVDVLFVPLVVTLAIGAGSLPRLLSTRVMVYLGHISFSLYMVHEIIHTAWNWVVMQFEVVLTPSWWAKAVVGGLILLALLASSALYHLVEEPARLWMRRMVDVRELPVDLRHGAGVPHGPLKSVHDSDEQGAVSARAG
ncbi:acyltransferase family protein [Mycolicibacterium mengxianglii]|uniref:acyltransferase family protein n=1 Tax=Mycolicibacterium mengxianglii TaxID=2736649 RepID=UPI001E43933B|nr:acyltransferase [Mycolicibacterium mengxianglii]